MIFRLVVLPAGCLVLQAACLAQTPALAWTHAEPDRTAAAAPRTLVPYFTPAGSQAAAPDADGFIRRWMLLEPIIKPNRTNTVFTGSYMREALNTQYFPDHFTVNPHKGDKVTVAGQDLAWHALDSNNFDVKLFRFAYGLNKTTYGVIFWAVTVMNSPRDMGMVTEDGNPIIAQGEYTISIGGGKPDTGAPVATGKFHVDGQYALPE